MRKLICVAILIAISGCSTLFDVNELKTRWKSSMAQLQITPIMPLRQRIEIGEVFRYLKKPKTYFSDGQIEPSIAFKLNIPNDRIFIDEKGNRRRWPEFSYVGNQITEIKATIKSVGYFAGRLDSNDRVTLQITDSFSEYTTVFDVLYQLCKTEDVKIVEKNGKKLIFREMYIKEGYRDKIDLLSNYVWKSYGITWSRNVIFIRIPIEVYYAKKINVMVYKEKGIELQASTAGGRPSDKSSEKSKSQTTQIDEGMQEASGREKLKIPKDGDTTALGFSVINHTESTVTLQETLEPPLAIGYRGIIVCVWKTDYRAVEYPEDATIEYWSDL